CATDIRWCAFPRLQPAAVDFTRGGEVDDRVGLFGEWLDRRAVANVTLNECETRIRLNLREILPATRIGQLVQHRDSKFWFGAQSLPNKRRTDEAGSTRDEQVLHFAPELSLPRLRISPSPACGSLPPPLAGEGGGGGGLKRRAGCPKSPLSDWPCEGRSLKEYLGHPAFVYTPTLP